MLPSTKFITTKPRLILLWIAGIIIRAVLTFVLRVIAAHVDIMLERILIRVDHCGNIGEDCLDLALLWLIGTRCTQKLKSRLMLVSYSTYGCLAGSDILPRSS